MVGPAPTKDVFYVHVRVEVHLMEKVRDVSEQEVLTIYKKDRNKGIWHSGKHMKKDMFTLVALAEVDFSIVVCQHKIVGIDLLLTLTNKRIAYLLIY